MHFQKVNEDLASVFSNQYKIKFIGLRFFTVYGEWGRPDMFMMKYLNHVLKTRNFF